MQTNRDDFIIAIRSAFLKKGNRQRFSLTTLIVISIIILIFEKYNFSVESFLNDQSSNLIIFSSWPNDFLNIKSVNKRKKLFINTCFVTNKLVTLKK